MNSSRSIARSLGAVSRRWLDPTIPWRRQAIEALQVSTGFAAPMIEAALTAAFEELTEAKIFIFAFKRLSENSLSPTWERVGPRSVLHILAGNVFTAWLPGAVITLLGGAECSLKPSAGEPVFAPLWKRSVDSVDGDLGRRIHVVAWNDALLDCHDAVVAYGSDETIGALRRKVPPGARFIGYGHKFSVAVIFKEALRAENRARLREQVWRDGKPFNLQGCLSPQIIYVEGTDPLDGLEFDLESGVRPRIERFEEGGELKEKLKTFQPHLSTLGYAGPAWRLSGLRSEWENLGFSRICPLGEMQRPPLDWKNGGIDLVEALRSPASFPRS